MRLLNAKTLRVEEHNANIPKYAILSHTWGSEEVSFEDISQPTAWNRAGYTKIEKACQQAIDDELQYIWIDTCCIDKRSSSELSEAINSMFQWYLKAAVCYAYLADVPSDPGGEPPGPEFEQSRWWTRGWTLQELLAPPVLNFYGDKWGSSIGTKENLSSRIAVITQIPERILHDVQSMYTASIAKRMSWASSRQTSRQEDLAYCLFGIFRVNLPLIYGEGGNAFIRLQEEIVKNSDDQSIFAWMLPRPKNNWLHRSLSFVYGPFAATPAAFGQSGTIVPDEFRDLDSPSAITNVGVEIRISTTLKPLSNGYAVAILACRYESELQNLVGIPIEFTGNSSFRRVEGYDLVTIRRDEPRAEIRTLYFLRDTKFRFRHGNVLDPCQRIVLGRLPPATSGTCIRSVEPGDGYNQEEGSIRFPSSKIIKIHLWDDKKVQYTVTLNANGFERPHSTVFYDSPQESNGLAKDRFKVTVGSPRKFASGEMACLVEIFDRHGVDAAQIKATLTGLP